MSDRGYYERPRTQRPSSPYDGPNLPSVKPAKTTYSYPYAPSSEDDWDSVDEEEYRGASRPAKNTRVNVRVQTRPVAERRESSRASRQRVPVPEAPAPFLRPMSRGSQVESRKLKDNVPSRSVPYPTPERQRRGSSDYSDDMPHGEPRAQGHDHRSFRNRLLPRGYASSSTDSTGGHGPTQPVGAQIIAYQQQPLQYYPQAYHQHGPPYIQAMPIAQSPHHVAAYFVQELHRPAQPGISYPYHQYPQLQPLGTFPMTPPLHEDDRITKLQNLVLSQESGRLAREREDEIRADAEKAATEVIYAKQAADRATALMVDTASRKAKADAEANAEKKISAAKDAEAAAKAEMAKYKSSEDAKLAPIKFKDAIGRKFTFPWRVCRTWKGMEELIQQAFAHIPEVNKHVTARQYDLLGPDGEIILPQVWESTIEPDWHITMHLWPIEEKKKIHEEEIVVVSSKSHRSPRQTSEYDVSGRKKVKKPSKTKPTLEVAVVPSSSPPLRGVTWQNDDEADAPPPPPPAPMAPNVDVPEPPTIPAVIVVREGKEKVRPRLTTQQGLTPFAAWVAGGRLRIKK